MENFIAVHGTQLLHRGRPVHLKGVNLGGWLMMEGYILHALNQAEQLFKRRFSDHLGPAALVEFEKVFRDNFIKEEDFATIASWGLNCVRLPFNCRLINHGAGKKDKGVQYLDKAIRWAKKNKLWVILDLHAAWGAQNHDWHSDSVGEARLWHSPGDQKRTVDLWAFLADRYRDETNVAGYDLLNEAVVDDPAKLNAFYREVVKTVRGCDRNHVIFVEGNRWATDIEYLERFPDDNLALSIHYYEPLEFTFNFVPCLAYPLKGAQGVFDRHAVHRRMAKYARVAAKYKAPVLVGEFGVNSRDGYYGEDRWVTDVLTVFEANGFHWTYWTYKAVKNSVFPDGIMSFVGNPPWVNRQGHQLGWDTYVHHWPTRKREIIRSWKTEAFRPNTKIINALKAAVHAP